MCNNYEQLVGWPAFSEIIANLDWRLPGHRGAADLPLSANVRVRDLAPVLVRASEGVDLVTMRWSFPPSRAGGAPVFNFRSEGRRFETARRCLAPASAFFEFTGSKSPKAKHRFTLANASPFGIAGIWREQAGNEPAAFTLLTTDAGPDVVRYHRRQIIALAPAEWPLWLRGDRPSAELLRPSSSGTFAVRTISTGSEPNLAPAAPGTSGAS